MADSPPFARSRSGSIGLGRPGTSSTTAPLAIPPTSPHVHPLHSSSVPAQSPSSALSQSLKAFADLALSPPAAGNPLDSEEFRQAFHHVRRSSFSQAATAGSVPAQVPGLSSSPTSSSEAGSVPTPSSSPPNTAAAASVSAKSRAAAPSGVGANGGTTTSTKTIRAPSSTLGGVCERPELEFEQRGSLALDDDDLAGDLTMSAPAPHIPPAVTPPAGSGGNGGIFAGGARWGWSGTSAGIVPSGPISPPAVEPFAIGHGRRASFTFPGGPAAVGGTSAASSAGPVAISTSPAVSNSLSTTSTVLASSPPVADPLRTMQPLGRVVSAGAALQTPQDGKSGVGDGLGLFRRFSISGIGARKSRPAAPASPPAPSGFSPQPAPTLLEPTHATLPPPMPTSASATAELTHRGRTVSPPMGASTVGGAKTKRRISPMGEKILRGGY